MDFNFKQEIFNEYLMGAKDYIEKNTQEIDKIEQKIRKAARDGQKTVRLNIEEDRLANILREFYNLKLKYSGMGNEYRLDLREIIDEFIGGK